MSRDPFDVEGKVVVVTGGLGQLGGQFSLALAARGAVFDLEADGGKMAERFGEAVSGDNLFGFPVDVMKRDSLGRGVSQGLLCEGSPWPHDS